MKDEYGAEHDAAVVDHRRHWLDGAEYALSEFGGIQHRPDWRAPLGVINVSEKTGLPLLKKG